MKNLNLLIFLKIQELPLKKKIELYGMPKVQKFKSNLIWLKLILVDISLVNHTEILSHFVEILGYPDLIRKK